MILKLGQGGSVMCDSLRSSYPAHPHYRKNSIPNEEQIENHQNFNFKKNVRRRSPPKQTTHWSKTCRIRVMRPAINQKSESRRTAKSNNNKH